MAYGEPDGAGLRVAIVGLGPKGLFALERLLHHAHRAGPRASLDVDVFEPAEHPGAGPVYDPEQPAYLRMNLAADRLTMWVDGSRAVAPAQRLSFEEWRAGGDGDGARERFAPRAQVGRYLCDGLAAMLDAAPAGVRVALHPSVVHSVQPSGRAWCVVAAGRARAYDEVLLATGHHELRDPDASGAHAAAGRWPRPAWQRALATAPLIDAVFPVTRRLTEDRVPAGATVAVRGFALTFIDAALALTEGRGGAFEPDRGHPYRLRYVPSGHDVRLILPFSRSGRPMLAKPEPRLAAGIPALAAIAARGRDEILALPAGFDVRRDLAAILAATAAASLVAARGQPRGSEALRRATADAAWWLGAACDGRAPSCGLAPAAEIEQSLAIGAGTVEPDLQWALGQAWRSVYPAIVRRCGATAMPERAWPVFHRLAAQMERLAFGPPAINAAKLLALVDAGRVDLAHVAGGQIATAGAITSLRGDDGEHAVDAIIDAVLPGPGARDGGLLAQLVAGGHARILAGRRGLDVASDATCIARDGTPAAGLSAIGRPTEDAVIGNDTLDRDLHPHADRWARRVVGRAVSAPSEAGAGASAAA